MNAIDSTGYIVHCMNRIHIHINNNDTKAFAGLILSLSNAYAKFGGGTITLGKDSADIFIPKEAVQAAYNERTEMYYD